MCKRRIFCQDTSERKVIIGTVPLITEVAPRIGFILETELKQMFFPIFLYIVENFLYFCSITV